MNNRAPSDTIFLYKLSIQLYKLYNSKEHSFELESNFNIKTDTVFNHEIEHEKSWFKHFDKQIFSS